MNAEKILAEIKKGKRIWVAAHIDPDGDAIASILLMGRLLDHLGKEYVMYLRDPIPAKFRFLAGIDRISHQLPDWASDTFISVDTTDPPRLGFDMPPAHRINIDHHPSNVGFGDLNWVQRERSAACLMVFELLNLAGARIDRDMGEMVYVGLFTETGAFSYPNVTAEAFDVAAKVLDLQVDVSTIAFRMTARDERNLALLGSVLATLTMENGVATIELTDSMLASAGVGRKEQDSDSFIRYPASIPGVKVAIFFREERSTGNVRLSMRSTREVDVNKLAARFGGGGHYNAAGARIAGRFEKVKQQVIAETKAYIKTQER